MISFFSCIITNLFGCYKLRSIGLDFSCKITLLILSYLLGGKVMKIELIGALDYEALKVLLNEKVGKSEAVSEIVQLIKELEIERRSHIVAAAGRLSRFAGNVFESLGVSEQNEMKKNVNYIKRVVGMRHDSITDHDYCVFAIQDVSPIIEQIIIAERFASFTIKSRREVDFSNVGFYTPDFHDKDGNVLPNNRELQEKYQEYMKSLFGAYSEFVDDGLPKEDARFVLPYCFYSNILMGVDAHTLKDMIVKFTKTKYANIQEVREFGERLYEIAKVNMPYLVDAIENTDTSKYDDVDKFLDEKISDEEKKYQVIDKPKLIAYTANPDDVILASALMRRYQYSQEEALTIINDITVLNPSFKSELMKKIAFDGDRLELSQVNFQFQIPVSYAILTHLTRHRTHHILIPDFFPVGDLMQYKVPPKVNGEQKEEYHRIFCENKKMFDEFKEAGVRDEDLVYFTLSGNMLNIVTNMDGKTLAHFLELRECNKAQWETRNIANALHSEVALMAPRSRFLDSVLGSTCMTQGVCHEGKESCGKVKALELKAQK